VKTCNCCVAFGSWYPRGADRLERSLRDQGYEGDLRIYRDALPHRSPTHEDVPYAFKLHAMQEAFDAGADIVLWADASMYAIAPISPLIAHIQRHGYALFRTPHNCGEWTSDACLNTFHVDRWQALVMPVVVGGLCGFACNSVLGDILFGAWQDCATLHPEAFRGLHTNDAHTVSLDPRCKGHRHDQSVLSLIAAAYNATLIDPPRFYTWDADNPSSDTVMVNRGM
jgi:hypothetical protein